MNSYENYETTTSARTAEEFLQSEYYKYNNIKARRNQRQQAPKDVGVSSTSRPHESDDLAHVIDPLGAASQENHLRENERKVWEKLAREGNPAAAARLEAATGCKYCQHFSRYDRHFEGLQLDSRVEFAIKEYMPWVGDDYQKVLHLAYYHYQDVVKRAVDAYLRISSARSRMRYIQEVMSRQKDSEEQYHDYRSAVEHFMEAVSIMKVLKSEVEGDTEVNEMLARSESHEDKFILAIANGVIKERYEPPESLMQAIRERERAQRGGAI